MNHILEHTITVFLAFFAVMNPVANTAVFAALTSDKCKSEQIKIARKSLMITFILIFLFAVLGKVIFHLFGITLPALQIAGGILVFLIGYHMLQGEKSKLHSAKENTDKDIAVAPLAVPILAGPGTIATAMNYSAAGGWTDVTVTIITFTLLCVITFFCFIFSLKIIAVIGENKLSIVTRLMGLILAVVGVQMLVVGAKAAMSVPVAQ